MLFFSLDNPEADPLSTSKSIAKYLLYKSKRLLLIWFTFQRFFCDCCMCKTYKKVKKHLIIKEIFNTKIT